MRVRRRIGRIVVGVVAAMAVAPALVAYGALSGASAATASPATAQIAKKKHHGGKSHGKKGPSKSEVKAGKSLYTKNCASCHGPKGTGTPKLAPSLKTAPRAKSIAGVIQQLTKPVTMKGYKVKMPSFKSKLSAKQKKQVAAFVTVDISKKVKAG